MPIDMPPYWLGVHKMIWDQTKDGLIELINNAKKQWIRFIIDQIYVFEGKQNNLRGKPQKVYVIDNDEAEKRRRKIIAPWLIP